MIFLYSLVTDFKLPHKDISTENEGRGYFEGLQNCERTQTNMAHTAKETLNKLDQTSFHDLTGLSKVNPNLACDIRDIILLTSEISFKYLMSCHGFELIQL